jgi:hypothetical protein
MCSIEENIANLISCEVGIEPFNIQIVFDVTEILNNVTNDRYWSVYEGWKPRYELDTEDFLPEIHKNRLEGTVGGVFYSCDNIMDFKEFLQCVEFIHKTIEQEAEEIKHEFEIGLLDVDNMDTDIFEHEIHERFLSKVGSITFERSIYE